MVPSVNSVYHDFIWYRENVELANALYDAPPVTMESVVERARIILSKYSEMLWHLPEKMELLERALVKSNKRLGCLTPAVRARITSLKDGAVESAHQTVTLGGPTYILNKAATAYRIAQISSERGLALSTFFCVADYDIVQSELTNIRVPVLGQGGTLVSIPVPEGYEHSPVSILPLPEKDWYDQIEDDIRTSYRPMIKSVEGANRLVFDERLEHALAITRWSFVNSKTLGEWAERIIGRLFNIEGNLNVPLLVASDEPIRDLLVEGLEYQLARENRERFLLSFNEVTDKILEAGYNPGIGHRNSDYVPFFYECQNDDCNRARIELHYVDRGANILLTGKCPSCAEDVQIETVSETPYLGELAQYLSLRVDSRQLAINSIIPTVVHVGGPGETAYYAQVIPSARSISIPFPMFVKYPRAYFNTPWNEQLAKSLEEKGESVLQRGELFNLMGKISKLRRRERYDEMNEVLARLGQLIQETHSSMNKRHEEVESKIAQSSGAEGESLINLKAEIERYLSWAFGQYTVGKLGQESSWSWIEWTLNSGFADLFGAYERAYVGPMNNGATIFINFQI
ncbi:bacillithiol biosynthesis BshC [Candidatus Thorarchaeota archaeon]|nr:MAG: bacillithiol biosynthesis BshC [Candidatus Thorarchaeota archaeon]